MEKQLHFHFHIFHSFFVQDHRLQLASSSLALFGVRSCKNYPLRMEATIPYNSHCAKRQHLFGSAVCSPTKPATCNYQRQKMPSIVCWLPKLVRPMGACRPQCWSWMRPKAVDKKVEFFYTEHDSLLLFCLEGRWFSHRRISVISFGFHWVIVGNWRCPKMVVPLNHLYILIGFSIINQHNQLLWGYSHLWKPPNESKWVILENNA